MLPTLNLVLDLLPERHDDIILVRPVVAGNLHIFGANYVGFRVEFVGLIDVQIRIALARQDLEHRELVATRGNRHAGHGGA